MTEMSLDQMHRGGAGEVRDPSTDAISCISGATAETEMH